MYDSSEILPAFPLNQLLHDKVTRGNGSRLGSTACSRLEGKIIRSPAFAVYVSFTSMRCLAVIKGAPRL